MPRKGEVTSVIGSAAIGGVSLGLGDQMMASAGISFIVGIGEGLPAIGGEKVASGRPLIALLAFPGRTFVDQGLIRMTVKDFGPDIK